MNIPESLPYDSSLSSLNSNGTSLYMFLVSIYDLYMTINSSVKGPKPDKAKELFSI